MFYLLKSNVVLLVLLLLGLYTYKAFAPERDLAKHLDTYYNIFGLYTFSFCNIKYVLSLSLGALILFSLAISYGQNGFLTILKYTSRTLVISKILVILTLSFFYTLINFVLVSIFSYSSVDMLTYWDDIISNLAKGYKFRGFNLSLNPKLDIIKNFTPFAAASILFLLLFNIYSAYGMFVFAISLLSNKIIAGFLGVFVAFMDLLCEVMLPYKYYYYSPFSWPRISINSQINTSSFPTLEYAFLMCDIIFIISTVVIILIINNRIVFCRCFSCNSEGR